MTENNELAFHEMSNRDNFLRVWKNQISDFSALYLNLENEDMDKLSEAMQTIKDLIEKASKTVK